MRIHRIRKDERFVIEAEHGTEQIICANANKIIAQKILQFQLKTNSTLRLSFNSYLNSSLCITFAITVYIKNRGFGQTKMYSATYQPPCNKPNYPV